MSAAAFLWVKMVKRSTMRLILSGSTVIPGARLAWMEVLSSLRLALTALRLSVSRAELVELHAGADR